MISVDTRELKQLESDLGLFKARALPFATQATLNGLAFASQKQWKGELGKRLVLKNKFTARSIRVDKAKGLKINAQESAVGSDAPYMERTERGGTVTNAGRRHPLPTAAAAGQSQGTRPRTRAPKPANRLGRMNLRRRGRVRGSRNQRMVATAAMALKHDDKFVYFDGAVYRVQGRVVGSRITGLRLTMMYNMEERSYRVGATPTMKPAVEATIPKTGALYWDALMFQLRKHKIMNFR